MKYKFSILLFVLISGIVLSQNITFDKEFNFSFDQVEKLSERDYLAAGYSLDGLIISRIDNFGYIKWIKIIKDASIQSDVSLPLFLLNDGFFIATNIGEANTINSDARIIKMDYDGNILYQNIFENTTTDESGFQIIEAEAGNYFFLTTSNLYKLTPSGDVLWFKKVYDILPEIVLFKNIIKFSDTMYIIPDYSFLACINENGERVWVKDFPNSFGTSYVFKNLQGDIFYIVRNKLYKLSTSGETLFEKVIKPNGYITFAYTTGNKILLAWKSSIVSKTSSLLTIESDSIITSEKIISLNVYQFVPTIENGFLFNGYKNGNRLIKTDSVLYYKAVTLKNPKLSYYGSYYSQNTNNQIYGLQNYKLTWEASDVEKINLDYSSDAGKNWVNIANNLSCDSSTYPPIGWDSLRYPSYEWTAPGIFSDEFYLRVTDSNDPTIYDRTDPIGSIFIYQDYDTIAANNITMWNNNFGTGSHSPKTDASGFFWPNNIFPNISAVFMDGLVWGGKVNGEIRVNGNSYRWGLQPGKILENGKVDDPFLTQSKIFKIRKDWQTLPEGDFKNRLEYDYNNWPVNAGAPWDDVNEDGVYTPGFDKPKCFGDETLFYVANDLDTLRSLNTYGSNPIGLEFQTTIFGFNREDLKDVVFKKYKVINKSNADIIDIYFTYWADVDLGYASDDLSAFDSTHNMAYVYNADNADVGYGNYGYGTPPPALAHMIVQGPIIPSLQTDSARFDDGWRTGYKNLGMTASGLIVKSSNIYPTDCDIGVYNGTLQFYNVMQGLRNDGSHVIDPTTNLPTVFPLTGDPVTRTGWYSITPGYYQGFDQRYHVPTGPFNLAVGDTQEIVIAIPIARGTDNINSITKLRELAAHVQEFYNTELVDILNTKQTVAPTGYTLNQNYPNPFNPKTTIEYEVPEKTFVTIKIYDILGREIQTLVNNEEKVRYKYKVQFDASTLASGVYFYRIQAGSFVETKKMVVLK